MVYGILTDIETGKINPAIRIVRDLLVIRSAASTYGCSATFHSGLLVFCAVYEMGRTKSTDR